MQINSVEFHNYRNLDGLEVHFCRNKSFIIGENGIGKSNILNAFSRIFVYGRFLNGDFFDENQKIAIKLRLGLLEEEIGSFEEYTDPKDSKKVNLLIEQEYGDFYFKVYHLESKEEVPSKLLKNVIYVYYDSLRNPKTELSFEKEKGSGCFLNYLVKKFLNEKKETDSTYIEKEKLSDAVAFINANIDSIRVAHRNKIKVDFDSDNMVFLNSIFSLYDSRNIELKKSGYGIQFNLLVIFSLFEKIIDIVEHVQKNGLEIKRINCVLAFDEPEIHLHPFAQRSLIKDLSDLAAGKDAGFNNVILKLFGIEFFSAQLIIVSHSDRIITGSYENIVRIYSNNEKILSISGVEIEQENGINKDNEKHLQKQFPYFTEALFARKVIFVEGESELGALTIFAKKLNIDLDAIGVSIINTSGESSMLPLIDIFTLFKIECVGVKDRDVYMTANGTTIPQNVQKYIQEGKLFLTDKENFEFEIIESFEVGELYNLLSSIDYSVVCTIQKDSMNKFLHKFFPGKEEIKSNIAWEKCHTVEEKNLFLVYALTRIKNISSGMMLADAIKDDKIPIIYKRVLEGVNGKE